VGEGRYEFTARRRSPPRYKSQMEQAAVSDLTEFRRSATRAAMPAPSASHESHAGARVAIPNIIQTKRTAPNLKNLTCRHPAAARVPRSNYPLVSHIADTKCRRQRPPGPAHLPANKSLASSHKSHFRISPASRTASRSRKPGAPPPIPGIPPISPHLFLFLVPCSLALASTPFVPRCLSACSRVRAPVPVQWL